jgi:hypothetical protein
MGVGLTSPAALSADHFGAWYMHLDPIAPWPTQLDHHRDFAKARLTKEPIAGLR